MTPDIMKEERAMRGRGRGIALKIAYAVLASVPMIAALCLAIYYIYGPGEGYFNSDYYDTLYWANAALEGNGIFDDQFTYAALLPFSTVWIMQPLIKIFGFGITAHRLGMTIFALIFAGSIYFFARSAKFSHLWSSTAVFAVFMLLSSSIKLREMMWGHTIYYSLGPVLMFLLLGLGIRFCDALEKGKPVRIAVWGALLLGMSIGSATNGMQVIVLSLIPALAAFAAERIFAGKEALVSKRSYPMLMALAVLAVGTVFGLKVLDVITGENIKAGYANAYSGWSDVGLWLENAQKFVGHYFSLFGIDVARNAPIFGEEGESFKYLIRLAAGILLIAAPVLVLCLYGKLRSRGVKFMVWAHFVLVAAVMFGFICGELSNAAWRLTPILVSSALLSICGLRDLVSDIGLFKVTEKTEPKDPTPEDAEINTDEVPAEPAPAPEISNKKIASVILSRVCSLMLAVIVFSSVFFANEVKSMPADLGRDNIPHQLSEFLLEKGLKYGYSTFWYCQSITVLTNSEVKVRCGQVDAKNGFTGRNYQTSFNWYNDQEGVDEYFVLLSAAEYTKVANSQSWRSWMNDHYVTHYEKTCEVDPEDDYYLNYGCERGTFYIYVFSENILRDFGSDARNEK